MQKGSYIVRTHVLVKTKRQFRGESISSIVRDAVKVVGLELTLNMIYSLKKLHILSNELGFYLERENYAFFLTFAKKNRAFSSSSSTGTVFRAASWRFASSYCNKHIITNEINHDKIFLRTTGKPVSSIECLMNPIRVGPLKN